MSCVRPHDHHGRVIAGHVFTLLDSEESHDKARLSLVQRAPGGAQNVEMVDDAEGGTPWMLLDTATNRLTWKIEFPSQHDDCPMGMVLTLYVAGEVKKEKLVKHKSTGETGTFAVSFQDISVATVADDDTHEDDGADVPDFLCIELRRAVRGDEFDISKPEYESGRMPDDEEAVTISEGTRKRGYLTVAKKSSAGAGSSKKAAKLEPNAYYGKGDPRLRWTVRAATYEHFIRRAGARFAGLRTLVDAGVTLPAPLDQEYARLTANSSAATAISLEDDDEAEQEAGQKDEQHNAEEDEEEDAGEAERGEDKEAEHDDEEEAVGPGVSDEDSDQEVEVKAEEEEAAEVMADPGAAAAMQTAAADDEESTRPPAPSACESASDVAGLEEVMKGIAPQLQAAARTWFAEQGLTSVMALVDLGAEVTDEFIQGLSLSTIAAKLVRHNLAKLSTA